MCRSIACVRLPADAILRTPKSLRKSCGAHALDDDNIHNDGDNDDDAGLRGHRIVVEYFAMCHEYAHQQCGPNHESECRSHTRASSSETRVSLHPVTLRQG